jgi:hypothetical protein
VPGRSLVNSSRKKKEGEEDKEREREGEKEGEEREREEKHADRLTAASSFLSVHRARQGRQEDKQTER